jgi:hypothetical protein
MEINMKIYEYNFETANGDIHHQVHVDWDSKGNLHFAEIDEGEGVKEWWNRDKYEYFFMVEQKDVAKFFLYCLWKGFTLEGRLTVADLKDMCDEVDIKYQTDFWC